MSDRDTRSDSSEEESDQRSAKLTGLAIGGGSSPDRLVGTSSPPTLPAPREGGSRQGFGPYRGFRGSLPPVWKLERGTSRDGAEHVVASRHRTAPLYWHRL